jgi:hypothetical protein
MRTGEQIEYLHKLSQMLSGITTKLPKLVVRCPRTLTQKQSVIARYFMNDEDTTIFCIPIDIPLSDKPFSFAPKHGVMHNIA